jgi:Cu2+-containing amine oxidase
MLYLSWPVQVQEKCKRNAREMQEKCKNRTIDACSLVVIKGGFIGFFTEDANRKSRQVSLYGSTPL